MGRLILWVLGALVVMAGEPSGVLLPILAIYTGSRKRKAGDHPYDSK